MLRVTRLTDYGIVLMARLARQRPDAVLNTRDLAVRASLPQSTVSKILKALCREGLLVSQRGIGGGYRLARPARTITVAEIVTALEGPIAVTQGSVPTGNDCPIGPGWQLIDDAVRTALGAVTLYEMTVRENRMVRPLGSESREGDES